MFWYISFVILIALLVLWRGSPRLRSLIYDLVIVDMTAAWYRAVLARLPRATPRPSPSQSFILIYSGSALKYHCIRLTPLLWPLTEPRRLFLSLPLLVPLSFLSYSICDLLTLICSSKGGSHTLDVGIGTGLALVRNADLIESKGLRFTGIDYDQDYVTRCAYALLSLSRIEIIRVLKPCLWLTSVPLSHYVLRELFKKKKLDTKGNEVHYASVYDWKGGPYDFAYFSGTTHCARPCPRLHIFESFLLLGSLMIMPDRAGALSHVMSLLKPGGKIYVTQTLEEKPNKVCAHYLLISLKYELTFRLR